MKLKLLFLLPIAFFAILTGCTKPIKGCTDKQAENYNAEATESDGNCSYARDKFLGSYDGLLDCAGLVDTTSMFQLEITENLNEQSQVKIEFKDTAFPIPILNGRIVGDSIYIDEETVKDVKFNFNGLELVTDITVSGEGLISEDKKTIMGELNSLVPISNPPTELPCTFNATKK